MVAIPHSLLLPCAPIFVGYSCISCSIASGAQYMTLEKYFSHPSCSYLLFFQPHKTESGTANRWETTNSNPPEPIKQPIRNREQSINTVWLCLLDCSKAPPGLWKLCFFPGSKQSFSDSLDCCTSSRISSSGSHTEHPRDALTNPLSLCMLCLVTPIRQSTQKLWYCKLDTLPLVLSAWK